ncbi:MAG: hypothetical protein NSGCLCUN01_02988 [uncultured Clostridium sp.]
MRVEKIKEILNSKRTLIISTVLVGAIAVVTAGTMILHNNRENKNVAVDNITEDKKVDEILEDNKEEENEELTEENIEIDKEIVENVDEDIHDKNNSTSQENIVQNSVSKNKQEGANQENSDKKVLTTNQPSTNNSSKVESSTSKPSSTTTNQHSHTWVEVYKDIHHAEEGHWENILVKDAWSENIPIYETKIIHACWGCDADITGSEDMHMKAAALAGNMACTAWRDVQKQVQTGTNTIKHDAEYEKKWIVDKAVWTEKVLSGYKCSSCGAIK